MHYFIMKALTPDKEWFTFDLSDIPTTFNSTEFVLLGRPNAPRLQLDSVKRGDRATGLFEGDILEMDGARWVVCYERGFYAISEEYVTKFLYQLTDYKIVGDYYKDGFPLTIHARKKHLFKYNDTIFRLEDIVGGLAGQSLILRCCSEPIPLDKVQQECCLVFDNKRVYLGDVIPEGVIELHGGRVCASNMNVYIELTTGGVIDGCTA